MCGCCVLRAGRACCRSLWITMRRLRVGARGCGWPVVVRRRDCPSRVVALCLLENKPLPVRLGHLVEVVPGARVGRDTAADRDRVREESDALPGLFPAPARASERGGSAR